MVAEFSLSNYERCTNKVLSLGGVVFRLFVVSHLLKWIFTDWLIEEGLYFRLAGMSD